MSGIAMKGGCRGCSLSLLMLLLEVAGLLIHLADGYAWCREYWNWDGMRNSKDGRRWPAEDGAVITYINGIFHSVPEWEGITHQLQAIFGHEVRAFYNPSSGWWITDASKAGFTLLRRPAKDIVAKALGEHLAQAVDDVGRGRVLHIAHSGGALVTYLAAQHHLSKRQRDKIDVLTFGGARSITRKYFSGRVVNYYARNDPLLKLDRRAGDLIKLTNDTNFQEVYEKHNTTFVFLEGRARHFVQDHSLEGPTYQYALRKEARAFRRAHFGPLSPLAWDYDMSLLRLARKKAAGISGVHNFFSAERFGLRSARKELARLTGFHGFFSGKLSGSGVEIAVVGDGAMAGALRDRSSATGVSTLFRRLWSWGWSSNEDVAAALLSEDAVPPRERFWVGFRWGRQDTKMEGSGGDVVGPLTIAELGPTDEDEEFPSGSSSPLMQQLRRAVWLDRRQTSAPPEEVVVDEEQGSMQEGKVDGKHPLTKTYYRPWSSTWWGTWGWSRQEVRDPPASAAPAVEASATESCENESEGAAARESVDQENVEQVPRRSGEALLEGKSYLWGWWPSPSSSTRSSGTAQVVTLELDNIGRENSTAESSYEDMEVQGWDGEGETGPTIRNSGIDVASGPAAPSAPSGVDVRMESKSESAPVRESTERGDVEQVTVCSSDALLENKSSIWRWWPSPSSSTGSSGISGTTQVVTQEMETAGRETSKNELSHQDVEVQGREGEEEEGTRIEDGGVEDANDAREEAVGVVASEGGREISSQVNVNTTRDAEGTGLRENNGATRAAAVEPTGISHEALGGPQELSNGWRPWQALKSAAAGIESSRSAVDTAPALEKLPGSAAAVAEEEAGTIGDGSGPSSADRVEGELVEEEIVLEDQAWHNEEPPGHSTGDIDSVKSTTTKTETLPKMDREGKKEGNGEGTAVKQDLHGGS